MAPDRLGRSASSVILSCHGTPPPGRATEPFLDEAARILDRWTQERYIGRGESWQIHPGGDAFWPVAWCDYLEGQLLYRDAKVLIDGAPPKDDPRLHVLRARALAGLDWVEQASVDFDTALRLNPQDSQIRLEAHRNRGKSWIKRRRWNDAAAEFAKACDIRPGDATLWRFQAVARFVAGDVKGYRQTCTSMLERFAQTDDRFATGNVLLACVLQDDAISDVSRLLPLTRVVDPLWHWGVGVSGAALYRAGRYQESVQCLENAARTYRPRVGIGVSAMVTPQGAGEARRCLAKRALDRDGDHHTEDDQRHTACGVGTVATYRLPPGGGSVVERRVLRRRLVRHAVTGHGVEV